MIADVALQLQQEHRRLSLVAADAGYPWREVPAVAYGLSDEVAGTVLPGGSNSSRWACPLADLVIDPLPVTGRGVLGGYHTKEGDDGSQ
jgi:hypothetical protein